MFGLVVGLPVGLSSTLMYGLVVGLVVGLPVGLIFGLVSGLTVSPQPSVRTHLDWRARLQYPNTRGTLTRYLVFGLAVGLVFGLAMGLLFVGGDSGEIVETLVFLGLVFGLVSGLTSVVLSLLLGDVVAADPPRRFAHARPDAVLTASRSNGLFTGLVGGLGIGLATGLLFGLAGGLVFGLISGLIGGLVFGLPVGLVAGLRAGLGAWLYHYWLRSRLVARGVLPARLPAFLKWCAEDEQGWLRISDAYEFRHRELLEHLAPATPPD